ncbi:MAG: tetratricopeptide repeat protein [Candidatus Latescibacter sp.]|nr:tetratricopeptide repeat protein [Candidatus Latescibacter sp.]
MAKQIKKTRKNPVEPPPSGPIVLNTASQYALLIVLMGVFIYFCIQNAFIQDDTYITLRYVKNFISGHGLVFNPGERVEGYTCFLWVMILSAAAVLGLNTENVSQYLSVFFGVLTLAVTFALYRIISAPPPSAMMEKRAERWNSWFALIPVLFLVSVGAFSFWSVSGMESSLFVFLVVTGLFFHLKQPRRTRPSYPFVISMIFATFTRPEGALFFAVIMLHALFSTFRPNDSHQRKSILRVFFTEIALFAVPYIAFTLFRIFYYGHLFPNTFYAKTGLSSVYLTAGITYFVQFVKAYLLYGFALAAPLFLLTVRERRFETSLFFSLILVYCIYVVSVGGDVLSLHRFFLPVLPLIFILWARFLHEVFIIFSHRRESLRLALFAATWAAVFAFAGYMYFGERAIIAQVRTSETGLVSKMKIKAAWLKDRQAERSGKLCVAATTVGALGYFSGVTVIDMLGLTDEQIAHHPQPIPEISADASVTWKEKKYNAAYVLSRKPDYIIFSTDLKPSAYAERALFLQPDFLFLYYPQHIILHKLKSSQVFYTRKNPEQVSRTRKFPPNPGFSAEFVGKYSRALTLISQHEWKKATISIDNLQTIAQDIIKTAPVEFGEGYRILGDVCRYKNDLNAAVTNYLAATERDEFNFESHFQLYRIYKSRNELTDSAIHLEKILKSSPYGLIFGKPFHLGVSFLQVKMYDDAIHELKAAAGSEQNTDDLSEIRLNLGSAYFAKSMLTEAVLECTEALRLKPGYAAAHFGLGQCYEKQGKPVEAQAEYREYMRLSGVK